MDDGAYEIIRTEWEYLQMIKFWEKYKFRIVPAAGLAILYLLIIGLGWLESGGGGEDLAFLLMYLNLPFYLLYWLISGGTALANSPMTEGVIIFLGSPLMYGLIGWLIGWAFEKCAVVPQEPNERYRNQYINEKKGKDKD
jgi:hypothetical protein